MSNGSSTGLEPAESGSSDNHPGSAGSAAGSPQGLTAAQKEILLAGCAILAARGEWRLEREVSDALARLSSEEGQRRSEAAHGEATRDAKALACTHHKMIVLPYDGRLSCGCERSFAVEISLGAKPQWLIEGRATGSGA